MRMWQDKNFYNLEIDDTDNCIDCLKEGIKEVSVTTLIFRLTGSTPPDFTLEIQDGEGEIKGFIFKVQELRKLIRFLQACLCHMEEEIRAEEKKKEVKKEDNNTYAEK